MPSYEFPRRGVFNDGTGRTITVDGPGVTLVLQDTPPLDADDLSRQKVYRTQDGVPEQLVGEAQELADKSVYYMDSTGGISDIANVCPCLLRPMTFFKVVMPLYKKTFPHEFSVVFTPDAAGEKPLEFTEEGDGVYVLHQDTTKNVLGTVDIVTHGEVTAGVDYVALRAPVEFSIEKKGV